MKDLNVKLILSGNSVYLISIRILFSCLSCESAYTDKPKIRVNLNSQRILKVVIIGYIYMWIWLEVLFLPFVKRFKMRIKLRRLIGILCLRSLIIWLMMLPSITIFIWPRQSISSMQQWDITMLTNNSLFPLNIILSWKFHVGVLPLFIFMSCLCYWFED